jgi:serine/threonine protein kinase/tetratricopeptide (TPR) repeat protein
MNEPRDPSLTADLVVPAAVADPAADPLATVDQARGSAGTEESLPAGGPPADPFPTIPGYRVLGAIARGGMGRVLAARDLTLDRDVAVKVLLPGADAGRFVRESKITARLPHPAIPPVYALGTSGDGSPFLAMKLVAGQTLAVEMKSGDRPRLLQVFAQVCQAVGFAHSRGVIHRDLKPQNVMVGAFGEVQVMDWGLAKELAGREDADDPPAIEAGADADDPIADGGPPEELIDRRTEVGRVMGTPGYMAPEQARGEPTDARGDVFALGGILCAILTGHPPFRGSPSREVIRRAAAGDLADARARLESCGADAELVALCHQCLSPVPAARPANGQAVADDLAAYLSGVQERLNRLERERAVAAARAVAERRRRTVVLVAGSLVALVLLAGVVGTTVGMFEARRQTKSAEEGWGRADTEKTRAEQNFATARALVLEMGSQFSQSELQKANPIAGDLARKAALDKARDQFDQFRAGRPDDEEILKQAALLHRFAANAYRTLGDFAGAAAAYSSAIQILEDLEARFPDTPDYRDELALALSDRAMLEKRTGKLKESAATLDRAVGLAKRQQGVLRDSSYRRTLGGIELDRSEVAYQQGQFDDSKLFAGRARELFDRLGTAPAAERQTTDRLFAALAVKREARALRELGRSPEAMAIHDDAVARTTALAGPQASRDERFEDCQGRVERARTAAAVPDRRVGATADLSGVIRLIEKLVEDFPDAAFYREGLAAAYLRHGELLTLVGRPAEAEAELTKSLAVSRTLLERHGVSSAFMLVRGEAFLALGRARAALGKTDEAVKDRTNAAKVFDLALRIDPDNFHQRRGRAEAERALKGPAK